MFQQDYRLFLPGLGIFIFITAGNTHFSPTAASDFQDIGGKKGPELPGYFWIQ
jgi:hypothetical protein